jgi:hypothetical protein
MGPDRGQQPRRETPRQRKRRKAREQQASVNGVSLDPEQRASVNGVSFDPEQLFGHPAAASEGGLDYLWTGRIRLGRFGLLDGPPFAGKSTLAAALAAAVTTGRGPPGWVRRKPAAVLWCSVEEDWATEVAPRLLAAGANLDLVQALMRRDECKGSGWLALPHESHLLRDAILRFGAGLVILDPLTSFLAAGVNVNAEQPMRDVGERLNEVARETGCTILVLRQTKKDETGSDVSHGMGSMGIPAVARFQLILRLTAGRDGPRVLTVLGLNGGKPARSMLITVREAGSCLVSVFGDELQADDPRTATTKQDRAQLDAVSDAERFLLRELRDGPKLAKDIGAHAKDFQISPQQLRWAKEKLGIKSDWKVAKKGLAWYWLPPGMAPWHKR